MGDLASKLHPLERKVLPFLAKYSTVPEIVVGSQMKEVEVVRTLQWLSNKEVVRTKDEIREVVLLDRNGIAYLKESLPERRFLAALSDGEQSIKFVEKKAGLSKEEVNICIGILKRKAAINIRKGKDLLVSLTDQGKALLKKETLEEKFLKKQFPADVAKLSSEEQYAFAELGKRKAIVKKETIKTKTVSLTDIGKKLVVEFSTEQYSDTIDSITPEIIKNKLWKSKKLRAYDVTSPVPRTQYGKTHFETQTISFVRKIFLELGFEEMTGNMVQPAFWNLDALFVPQDHPAREMQDTFYLKLPAEAKLPKIIVQEVKKAHETGSDTGSKGWQASWSEEKAKEILLRTHTTVLSARAISQLKEKDFPKKYFSIGKVFRNEATDWKHLFEFYQVEGIVVDRNATFGQLLWYLKEFYTKMGYNEIRFKPSYFPFTEPSVEVEAYNKNKEQWVELGGAGMFRPEVVKPLMGTDVTVLAWGLGLGRIMVPYFNITDLREINSNKLSTLRNMKHWV